MVDTVLDLTQDAARAIEQRPEFSLVAPPSTVMVAFRHRGGDDTNIRIHRALFASGAGGDRAHAGRRRGRAQAHAPNPATTPRTSTRCST